MQTAEAIAAPWGLPVQPHPGLLDIAYGAWEGLTPAEVAAGWPVELATWQQTPHLAQIPGGETLQILRARGVPAMTEIVERHPEQTVVVVGHTVINRVLVLSLLGMGLEHFWQLRQAPCAINVLEAQAGQYTLRLFNQTMHLQPLLSKTS